MPTESSSQTQNTENDRKTKKELTARKMKEGTQQREEQVRRGIRGYEANEHELQVNRGNKN